MYVHTTLGAPYPVNYLNVIVRYHSNVILKSYITTMIESFRAYLKLVKGSLS